MKKLINLVAVLLIGLAMSCSQSRTTSPDNNKYREITGTYAATEVSDGIKYWIQVQYIEDSNYLVKIFSTNNGVNGITEGFFSESLGSGIFTQGELVCDIDSTIIESDFPEKIQYEKCIIKFSVSRVTNINVVFENELYYNLKASETGCLTGFSDISFARQTARIFPKDVIVNFDTRLYEDQEDNSNYTVIPESPIIEKGELVHVQQSLFDDWIYVEFNKNQKSYSGYVRNFIIDSLDEYTAAKKAYFKKEADQDLNTKAETEAIEINSEVGSTPEPIKTYENVPISISNEKHQITFSDGESVENYIYGKTFYSEDESAKITIANTIKINGTETHFNLSFTAISKTHGVIKGESLNNPDGTITIYVYPEGNYIYNAGDKYYLK